MRMVVGACGRQKQGANFSGFKIWCVLFVFLKLEKPLDIQIQLCQELAVRTRNSNATSRVRLLEHTPKPKSILLAVLLKSRPVCLSDITRRAIGKSRTSSFRGPAGQGPAVTWRNTATLMACLLLVPTSHFQLGIRISSKIPTRTERS